MNTNSKNIYIGKTTDTFEDLQILCKKEAENIARTLILNKYEKTERSFWTSDFPELICIATFRSDENSKVTFDLDFEQTTL